MASLVVIRGFGWGVDKETVTEGAGLTAPGVVGASSLSSSSVLVQFSQDMAFIGSGSVLDTRFYQIHEALSGKPLPVLGVTQQSDTHVVLLTPYQEALDYDVLVGQVESAYGIVLAAPNNDATFTGTSPTYPTHNDGDLLLGTNVGIQKYNVTGLTPDPDPPYLQNQVPLPTTTGVSQSTTVTLEVVDAVSGTDGTSVVITVAGTIAWQSGAQQNGFGVVATVVGGGFKYVITPPADLPEWEWIVVGVVADDLAPVPNTLSTSYQFQTSDITGPVLQNQNPAPGQGGVNLASNVVLEVVTTGVSVNEGSVIIKVAGVTAYSGGAQQSGFTVGKLAILGGFRYTVNPDTDFPSFTPVQIEVYAEDNAP